MLKIGLTGGLGSGKTTVSKIFASLGVPVFCADDIAKEIMNNNEDLRQKLIRVFGNKAYTTTLNRKYIADIVFKDAFKLEQLNALVHPLTIAAADKWMKQQTQPYAIKEAALMFEAAAGRNLDYIIGVYAPQFLRIKRAMLRDNANREQVLSRIDKQIDETLKMKLCNFVIINDEQQAILPQVEKLHQHLLALHMKQQ